MAYGQIPKMMEGVIITQQIQYLSWLLIYILMIAKL